MVSAEVFRKIAAGWLARPLPGDQLIVDRSHRSLVPYQHHGILVENAMVIHFNGEKKDKFHAIIQKTTLDEFCDGDEKCLRRGFAPDDDRALHALMNLDLPPAERESVARTLDATGFHRHASWVRGRDSRGGFVDDLPERVIAVSSDPAHCRAILTRSQVVSRAYSRLGYSGYDLFNNNCEDFARWCLGFHQGSQQVRAFKHLAAFSLGTALAGAALAVLIKGASE